MSAAVQPQEVGPVYDLLLSTRDGKPLNCRNRDGAMVPVSQLAYMTTIDAKQGQHEETELQHKDQVIQLASSNIIDREVEQWPQVTQGDWSGGILQRVLTGGNPLVSFGAQSDPSRYFDGQGVIWPIFDIVPQRPVLGDAAGDDSPEGGAAVLGSTMGSPSGQYDSNAASYAYVYEQTTGSKNDVLVITQPGLPPLKVVNPAPFTGSGLLAGGTVPSADMFFGGGVLWWIYQNGSNITITYFSGATPTQTTFATITGALLNPLNSFAQSYGAVSALGMIGNKLYLAVTWQSNTTSQNFIRLFDVTTFTSTSFIDIPFMTTVTASPLQGAPSHIAFSGGQLMIACSTLDYTNIVSYDVASGAAATVARLPNTSSAIFCSVAGSLFIITSYSQSWTPDLYLLTGSNLQHVGNITAGSGLPAGALPLAAAQPVAFGPYAVFSITYRPRGQVTQQVAVFAFDVERGRMFKLNDLGPFDPALASSSNGTRMGVGSPFAHTFQGRASTLTQWGVVVPIVAQLSSLLQGQAVQTLLVGIVPGRRHGVQIVSSIIDFTAGAENKLYRQIVATFEALPPFPISVTIDIWLDQQPDTLSLTPDASITTNGLISPGLKRLALSINRIARKLIYRVTISDPLVTAANTITPAPALQSVAVQAATGWVQTLMIDLAPKIQSNGKSVDDIWTYQGIDHVAAYNFIKQLWRLRGGEVNATFPNGDSGPWLLQDIHFDSPKPFSVAFRADQRNEVKYICQLKMREDIA